MDTVVFCDVDGTLLNSDHRITALTERAIQALRNKKIPFVIVSARSPSGIDPILRDYGFRCPMISYSGALILDENKRVLFSRGIARPVAKEIIGCIEASRFDMAWCAYSLDQWIVKDKSDPRILREEAIVRAKAAHGSMDSLAGDAVHKILCICNPAKLMEIEAALKGAFPRQSIVRSSDILLEIMEQGVTKAAAVRTLCSLWDIPLRQAIAFGDNHNDAEMLDAVGHGFLMGNAPEDLKRRIPLHAPDNDHDGIYHALAQMNLI